MINEIIFLAHALLTGAFALISLRFGKEALVAFIAISGILANLFVVKQITLFGLTATGSDAFTIGAVLGLNLLQEYYGRESTIKAIWISFIMLVLYGVVSQIHLAYVPSSFDTMHTHFAPILGLMPRIVVASFTAYIIVAYFETWLYKILKTAWHEKHLVLRNYISMSIAQLLDTILFSFLGLYGIVENVWHIIAISYAIKIATIIVATPLVGFSKYFLQKKA